jgi:Ca-activated chloride channel family protein
MTDLLLLTKWFPDAMVLTWPFLLWLLPLPLLVYYLIPSAKKEEQALLIPNFHTLKELSTIRKEKSNRIKIIILFVIWSLTLLAATRPQWIGDPVQLPSTGRDLLLAVDISQSMEREDMVINGQPYSRILVVKNIVKDFVEKRNGDRLGLVVFGTKAFLHVPLTFDRTIVGQQLQEAQLGFAGPSTAIGDAIAIAVKKIRELPEQESEGRILILLTDGANTAGEIEPREAARLAKSAKLKIYTIGLGADSMIDKGFLFSREINPSADLDEATLKYIADETGGLYFRARDPQQLQEIYHAINKLEPLPQADDTFRPTQELFYYPLAIALALSIAWAVIEQLIRLKNRRAYG